MCTHINARLVGDSSASVAPACLWHIAQSPVVGGAQRQQMCSALLLHESYPHSANKPSGIGSRWAAIEYVKQTLLQSQEDRKVPGWLVLKICVINLIKCV